jgi:uncharacterized protein YukE
MAPGRDLLARVDDTLVAAGAPADHPLWTLLRRVGALPGEAADAIAALRPEPLEAAADEVRALAETYASESPDPDGWTGTAARAYAARWRDLSGHLDDVATRLAATGAHLTEVADWTRNARRALVAVLADALGSAEAVRLRASGTGAFGDPSAERVEAAARVGARVLDVVARTYDDGRALVDRWTGRLDELPYRPAADAGAAPVAGTTTVPH